MELDGQGRRRHRRRRAASARRSPAGSRPRAPTVVVDRDLAAAGVADEVDGVAERCDVTDAAAVQRRSSTT